MSSRRAVIAALAGVMPIFVLYSQPLVSESESPTAGVTFTMLDGSTIVYLWDRRTAELTVEAKGRSVKVSIDEILDALAEVHGAATPGPRETQDPTK